VGLPHRLRRRRKNRSHRERSTKNYLAECSGDRSVPSAADARSRSKACRANRTFIISAELRAVFGKQLTVGRIGLRCSTKRTFHRSARSRLRLRTTTSFTSARVKQRFAGTRLMGLVFTNRSTPARAGKTSD